MNLSDLRKVTIKQNLRIRFALANGMECVVNEHGVAQVPALRAVPDFNLEDELTRVSTFVVEPADVAAKSRPKPRNYTREEMAALASSGGGGAAHDEHEE